MLQIAAWVAQSASIIYIPSCDWDFILNEICGGYQVCAYYWWYASGCG